MFLLLLISSILYISVGCTMEGILNIENNPTYAAVYWCMGFAFSELLEKV